MLNFVIAAVALTFGFGVWLWLLAQSPLLVALGTGFAMVALT